MNATHRAVGYTALTFYIFTIFAANWFIMNVGEQFGPDAPHVIPVGFGLYAPSGVLWVGFALVARDLVQFFLGRKFAVGAILIGAALSYVVAPSLALASCVAFLLSETADFGVYTPLIGRGKIVLAVFASGLVGIVVDSVVFLTLAFGSLEFVEGQILGKFYATCIGAVAVWSFRKFYPSTYSAPQVPQ